MQIIKPKQVTKQACFVMIAKLILCEIINFRDYRLLEIQQTFRNQNSQFSYTDNAMLIILQIVRHEFYDNINKMQFFNCAI